MIITTSKNDLDIRKIYTSIAKSGSLYLLSTILLSISALFFWFVLAKKYPAVIYGEVRTIYAIAMIISAFHQFGLATYNQIIFSKGEKIRDEFVNVIFLKLFLILLYTAISIIYFIFINNKFDIYFAIIIVAVALCDDLVRFISGIYYGKNEFNNIFKSVIVSRAILITLLIYLFYFTNELILFIYTLFFVNIIHILMLMYGLNIKYYLSSLKTFSLTKQKKIFLVLVPLGLNNIFNLLYDKIDIPLIDYFIGFDKVAQYSIAYSIYYLSGILFGFIFIPIFNLFSNENIIYINKRKIFYKACIYIIVLSCIISISFLTFGQYIIVKILGEKYSLAGKLLPYFSVSVFLWGLNGLSGIYLNAQKKFKSTMIAVIFGFLTNIIIDIIALQRIGVMGGVLATTISAFVVLAVEYYFIIKLDKEHLENSISW